MLFTLWRIIIIIVIIIIIIIIIIILDQILAELMPLLQLMQNVVFIDRNS